jgi:alanyl-tRNA synthetase
VELNNVGEIGGPDSEIFYDFGEELGLHEKSQWKSEKCHPNCDCGRFLEIGNSVFIQYKKVGEKALEELPAKNVDFGGGLERITAAVNNDPDIFKIDIFKDLISLIVGLGKKYENDEASFRIIADHMSRSIY